MDWGNKYTVTCTNNLGQMQALNKWHKGVVYFDRRETKGCK